MKRCKICHVEAELVDGRCHSCRMAKEATDHHMTYGKYKAMVEPPETAKMRPRTPEILMVECVFCGKLFPKFGTQRYCSELCRQEKDYLARRDKLGLDVSDITPQKCLSCGKMYMPKRRGTKYCSKKCANSKKAAYIRWEAKKNDRPRTD